MWNPFRPKPPTCPIEPEQQRWLDARFAWLEKQFGPDTPRRVRVVLPTPEFFPDPYDARPADAHAMFTRVAGYMNVDPSTFDLFLYEDAASLGPAALGIQATSGTAGLYYHAAPAAIDGAPRRPAIGIEAQQLADPTSLVATLAHEICHELLLGAGRLSTDEADHEPVTDLLTVFLGMGVFTANATIRDRGWSQGLWAGWHTSRHGYLDQRMLGYALAKFATARGESDPPWARDVRPDVRLVTRQAIRYLSNVADPR